MEMEMVRSEGGIRTRLMATMSYLGILCLVPLVMNGKNEFVYFHARQGLIIWIWSVLAIFALYVPGVGPWFSGVSALAVVVLSVCRRWPWSDHRRGGGVSEQGLEATARPFHCCPDVGKRRPAPNKGFKMRDDRAAPRRSATSSWAASGSARNFSDRFQCRPAMGIDR